MSKKLTIYGRTTPYCPFCENAKQTAEGLGFDVTYKDLAKNEWSPAEVGVIFNVEIKTVPVIVIEGEYVGGFDNFVDWLKTNSVEKPM